MPQIAHLQVGKHKERNFHVVGNIEATLALDHVTITGTDKNLLSFIGRRVSFEIVPDEAGKVLIGGVNSERTSVDIWTVPSEAPAPKVMVNIAPTAKSS